MGIGFTHGSLKHRHKERLNAKQSCLSYAGLTKELTQWKKEEDLFFLKQVHSQALQQSLKNLSQALKEAFDKTNPKQFPKFKKKGQKDSFRYPQGFKVDNENGALNTSTRAFAGKRSDPFLFNANWFENIVFNRCIPTEPVKNDLKKCAIVDFAPSLIQIWHV